MTPILDICVRYCCFVLCLHDWIKNWATASEKPQFFKDCRITASLSTPDCPPVGEQSLETVAESKDWEEEAMEGTPITEEPWETTPGSGRVIELSKALPCLPNACAALCKLCWKEGMKAERSRIVRSVAAALCQLCWEEGTHINFYFPS